jgi:hypothetical protein
VHDLSDLFDPSADPFFFDIVHVNEAGNRVATGRLAEIVAAGIPGTRSHARQ